MIQEAAVFFLLDSYLIWWFCSCFAWHANQRIFLVNLWALIPWLLLLLRDHWLLLLLEIQLETFGCYTVYLPKLEAFAEQNQEWAWADLHLTQVERFLICWSNCKCQSFDVNSKVFSTCTFASETLVFFEDKDFSAGSDAFKATVRATLVLSL